MKNVTDRTSNPFGMRPPCRHDCDGTVRRAVHGYGDANADFHLVGDHPGVHGGRTTGVPFTGSVAGERIQPILNEVGLVGDAYSDEPAVANLFLSYLHSCCLPEGREPTAAEYDDLERFFDAELRAIAAHVLLPVGERATRHVLREYTAREAVLDSRGMAALHADHVPGRGFLVVPVREPTEWDDGDGERLAESLADLLASDYRQTADLSRFLASDETYEVR
ncbi:MULTISPECIES: uracil-DNA glycosylase family protein [Halorussus]|uniref:uracil-DNA glycosylase family protein n=1 Tax=Halorussus TaxID=1070314 RepID=UPI00209CE68F|nr:uracil-DNA glycosylase family protein [Halorussus vallis]USZ77867.1 uracil-DNA glycosylase [Halorussus vallis]